jgi:hypothetical protein
VSASSIAKAQEDDASPITPIASTSEETPPAKKQYYLFSPRVSVTVPHPIGNKSFKKCFVGIYEISAGINLMLYKGFFIGVTGKDGLLKITENRIADYNADMHIDNAAVKIGSDFYIGEKNKVILSAALSLGKNRTKYAGIICKDPSKKPMITSYTTTYFEPEVNLFFLVEPNFGVGATVSYSIFNRNFDPYELCLNDWTRFDTNNTGLTQYFSFGFGFYYSLVRKKNKL